jgi:hypothetical protein
MISFLMNASDICPPRRILIIVECNENEEREQGSG